MPYIRDARFVRPKAGYTRDVNTSNERHNNVGQIYEEITSSRSDAGRGTVVPDMTFDPYMGFIRRGEDRKIIRALSGVELSGGENFTPLIDNGHPFLLERWSCGSSAGGLNLRWGNNRQYVGGPGYVDDIPLPSGGIFRFRNQSSAGQKPSQGSVQDRFSSAIVPPPALGSDLDAFGRRAISKVAPGRPRVDAWRAVAELALGLPALPFKAISRHSTVFAPKKYADDYPSTFSSEVLKGDLAYYQRKLVQGGSDFGSEILNVLFGIAPTVQDVASIGFELSRLSTTLLQLQKDAGRVVRRSYRIPIASRSTTFENVVGGRLWFGKPVGYNYRGETIASLAVDSSRLRSTVSLTHRESTWFSGAFTYFLPTLSGFEERLPKYLHELQLVVNLEPTRKNLWEISPWSWLIDWLVDVKSAISMTEIITNDSLVMRYGYAMRRTECVAVADTTVVPGAVGLPDLNGFQVRTSSRYTRMQRIRANPYGFTPYTDPQMSEVRWAILAALGLSKLR